MSRKSRGSQQLAAWSLRRPGPTKTGSAGGNESIREPPTLNPLSSQTSPSYRRKHPHHRSHRMMLDQSKPGTGIRRPVAGGMLYRSCGGLRPTGCLGSCRRRLSATPGAFKTDTLLLPSLAPENARQSSRSGWPTGMSAGANATLLCTSTYVCIPYFQYVCMSDVDVVCGAELFALWYGLASRGRTGQRCEAGRWRNPRFSQSILVPSRPLLANSGGRAAGRTRLR
jgi:hypothetical protein